MTSLTLCVQLLATCVWMQPTPGGTPVSPTVNKPLAKIVRVAIRADKTTVPVGSPVYLEFVVQNRTGDPVTLAVPGALRGKETLDYGMGLPLEHVFSGINHRGLEVASEENAEMGHRVARKPQYPVPPVTIAPYGSVGLRFDVARFYPGLHQSGIYVLSWKPYGAALETAPLTIKVVSYKQAVIETDMGSMNMRLLYDKAPKHVENFLELAGRRFYNGSTFHMLFSNQFLLGGCPIGDGTGKREDGVTLAPEFNDTPFEFGTVGMALVEDDPNSASCQFFICLSRQPAWDGQYTAFGRIHGPESLATLKRLGALPSDDDRRPLKTLKIKSISVLNVPFIPRPAE